MSIVGQPDWTSRETPNLLTKVASTYLSVLCLGSPSPLLRDGNVHNAPICGNMVRSQLLWTRVGCYHVCISGAAVPFHSRAPHNDMIPSAALSQLNVHPNFLH